MIRYIALLILFLAVFVSNTTAQETREEKEGEVTYLTSTSVYVRFSDTDGIQEGDTLFIIEGTEKTKALIVKNKSSMSVVCAPLPGFTFRVGDVVIAIPVPPPIEVAEQANRFDEPANDTEAVLPADTIAEEVSEFESKQRIGGRVSVSSYTNWANVNPDIGQRLRYTFSFSGENLGGSKFSFETYMSYVQLLDAWKESKGNSFEGLKIYNFSARYDITSKTRIWLGRKINYRLTSLGAVDGLQFEHSFRSFTLGLVAGTRPDYVDYGFNASLFQYGLYLSHQFKKGTGKMESTLAFMNQSNNWNTDRRFLYFQHVNMLLKKLFFIATAEIDLYSVADSMPQNSFNLSNLYVMLRYKILNNLSVSASYNARKNIILYETNKDYLERLLETGTLQGYRMMVNYRVVRNLTLGIKGSYRYRVDDPEPALDFYGYVNYSLIPGLKVSALASITWLKTSYIRGWVYSIGVNRDFFKGKLYGGANYRYVSYDYTTTDLPSVQHVLEANLNWRIYRKLTLGAYYETTFEGAITFNRVYLNLTQRF